MSDLNLRNWCFTTFDLESFVVPDTDKNFRYCIYQVEKCPKTQKLHIQGYVEFTRTMRLKKIKELFNDDSMHLEMRQGTREQARNYCRKQESRWAEPIEFGTWEITPGKRLDLAMAREIINKKRKRDELYQDPELDQVMTKYPKWAETVLETKKEEIKVEIELYPWQIEVLGLLDGPPVDRRIIWIWSAKSKTGKTTFFNYCCSKKDILPANGKFSDILYAYDKNEVIWFDYTRAQQGYESYDSLEKFSNHSYHLSTKFRCVKKFVRAHVVVTANHPPDETRLPDRFVVYNIDPPTQQYHPVASYEIND